MPGRSQNKGLSKYQMRASQQQNGPSPAGGREAGGWQPEPEKGNLSPRDGILYQTASRIPVANQVFLGSWTVDIHQEGCSQRSAPQRRHTAHLRWHSHWTPRNQVSGSGEVIRCTAHLGRVHPPNTWWHELLGPGRAQNAGPTESVPLWSTREPKPRV